VLGGVGVAPLQREAGQRAQVIYGEEMPVESQPPGGGIGGSGNTGSLAQPAGLLFRSWRAMTMRWIWLVPS
jgi:hypothetical protein